MQYLAKGTDLRRGKATNVTALQYSVEFGQFPIESKGNVRKNIDMKKPHPQ